MNETKLMMQPFANWEKYLTPIPLAIAYLGELIFISSKTNFSICKNPPKDGYKLIKYPDSFRACLMQVCNSGWKAFNEAHKNMDQIRLHTAQVPDYMKTAVNILFQGDDEVIKAHLPDQLDNIRVIADECLELSDATEKRFTDVINIIQELLEACVNAEHFYEEEMEAIKKKLEEINLRKQSAQEIKKRTEKAVSAMEKEMEEAHESYRTAQVNKTRETYEKCVDNLENNQKELTEILVTMRNCELKIINFKTTVNMLVKEMDAMGRVKQQWGVVQFFQMVSTIVKTSLTKTLTNFVFTSEKTQALSYNTKLFSKDLLYIEAFQACNIASLVNMISGTYTDVSDKYLMDHVSSLGKLMVMDISKPEFGRERLQLQIGCDEAQRGTLRLVLKNKEEFDRKNTARLERISEELLAILPNARPEQIKRTQEAVQTASKRNMKVMDSAILKSTQSLTTAEDMRNETKLMMQSYANWEEYLISIQQLLAVLGELVFISSSTDFSICKNLSKDTFIKYSDSFCACLMQVCNFGWYAFNEAHKSMDQICFHTAQVPDYMKAAVKILFQGDDEVIKAHLPDQLDNIRIIADECLELSDATENRFTRVINIIQELLEAFVNAEHFYEEEMEAVKKKLEDSKLREQSAQETKKRTEKAVCAMERELKQPVESYRNVQLNKTRETYEKCVENNQKELTEILVTMRNCEMKIINFKTTIEMLVKGMDAMGRVKVQWEKMVQFFQMVFNIVKTSLSKTFTNFINTSEKTQVLSYNGKLFSKELLYNEAFQTCNIASLVNMISATYKDVSNKYLMYCVSSLGKLMVMNKSKPEFKHEQQQLQIFCDEAQRGILRLVLKNKEEFDRKSTARLERISGELLAILPNDRPEQIKRIQEAAFSEEDDDIKNIAKLKRTGELPTCTWKREVINSIISKTSQRLKTVEDMRNQTKCMMQPFLNWEEYLTPVPLSVAILGELVIISSLTDFSINKNPPKDSYKFIKYIDSFRACLMQVCNSFWWAFNEAHTSINQIRHCTAQVPDYMKTALKILFQDEEIVKALLPDQLDNIRVIADECLELSNVAEKRFTDVISIIQELIEACVNAEHFCLEEMEAIKKKQKEHNLRQQSVQVTEKTVNAIEIELRLIKLDQHFRRRNSKDLTHFFTLDSPGATIEMLVHAIDVMGRMKVQWEKTVHFFQMLFFIVKPSLTKTLTNFVSTSEKTQALSYNTKLFSKDLLHTQAFQACNIASLVNMISGTYTDVSDKYLMDHVSSLGKLVAMDKSKPDFEHERQKLQNGCDEAQRGILNLVLKNKNEFDRKSTERLERIDQELLAILPDAIPEQIKRIQEVGFTEEEEASYY